MNTVRLCPREPTFHNGQRVDPFEGLDVPKGLEANYLEARGWRRKPVVDAERAEAAKAQAKAKADRNRKVRDELAKAEKAASKRGAKKEGAA